MALHSNGQIQRSTQSSSIQRIQEGEKTKEICVRQIIIIAFISQGCCFVQPGDKAELTQMEEPPDGISGMSNI